MPTLNEYKESLKDHPDQASLLPLYEIIEDVFLRRESKGLLLHSKHTPETIDLNEYDRILFHSFQKKEQTLHQDKNDPHFSESEYQRKTDIRDRASNNYFAFNSALTSLNTYLP